MGSFSLLSWCIFHSVGSSPHNLTKNIKRKGHHLGGIVKSLRLKFSFSIYDVDVFAVFCSVLDSLSIQRLSSPFPENKPPVFTWVEWERGICWCPEQTLNSFTPTCICNGEDSSKAQALGTFCSVNQFGSQLYQLPV